ncbi:MAG: HDIG domain-containing protein [Candidatus Electryonea clarkiae]|nr:HDIG domain-containing protein [Candidatus Electryonea clarkiae]MDP8289154.1 HDIG domain-containing protein [Candidatus Electryonea clarkiae]
MSKRDRKIPNQLADKGLYPALPWILWFILSMGVTLLFPRSSGFHFSEFTIGSISSDEIIAPFDFEILKSEDELAMDRKTARNSIEPVFVSVDSIAQSQKISLGNFLAETRQIADTIVKEELSGNTNLDSLKMSYWVMLRNKYGLNITYPSWKYILNASYPDELKRSSFIADNALNGILSDLLDQGILDIATDKVETPSDRIRIIREGEEHPVLLEELYDLAQARQEALARLDDLASKVWEERADSVIKVGYELIVPFLEPNLIYDNVETESRKQAIVDKVPLVEGIVLRDERIIDSNERLTQHHLDVLRSMEFKKAELASEHGFLGKSLPWIGRFLLSSMIFMFFGYWIRRFRPDIYYKTNHLLLLSTLFALLVGSYGMIIIPMEASSYLFPSALGAIILAIVFDAQIALLFTITASLLIGALTGNDFFVLLAAFLPALFSIFVVLRVRTRVQIMHTSILIFVGLLLVIIVQRILTYQMDLSIFYDILYAGVNSVATPLISLGLLVAIESVFGVTSDLTLLELADLNRPLLKRLSIEAPGTYHHSILVGNLAEAASEAIDANPILTRAGAYYHDIGKMVRREYFIENQIGPYNIHDDMSSEESAKYLKGHVLDGVELAGKYRLPESVKAFIREHHGTSFMTYFYNKALEEGISPVLESSYRYPGPRPQSKETGILMLADGAEAATRSIEDPTAEKIEKIVREIVINKYRDKELDECPLTLRDIRLSIEAFLPILTGIHHHRIQYPTREEVEEKNEKIVTDIEEKQVK